MNKVRGVYIHVPFCSNICNYCDFCKMYYRDDWADKYIKSLKKEIEKFYQNDKITSIYIGGGTPSALNINQLEELLKITQLFKHGDIEFTFESNIDIDLEKLELLKRYGVNRISIGVETFDSKLLKILGRNHTKEQVVEQINLIAKYFDNINIDLIYAIPGETKEILEKDLQLAISLPITHLSAYSLIIEENTKLYIDGFKQIDEELDFEMYEIIKETMKKNEFIHYETSNYCKKGFESKHNLTYWDNNEYYGFGLSSSGYIDNVRYTNTRGLNNYLKGKYRLEEQTLTKSEIIENEFILGLRKINGIDMNRFVQKYGTIDLKIIEKLIKKGDLVLTDNILHIPSDKEYIANSVLIQIIGEFDEV